MLILNTNNIVNNNPIWDLTFEQWYNAHTHLRIMGRKKLPPDDMGIVIEIFLHQTSFAGRRQKPQPQASQAA
ncbi:MAG: hypothetical protein ACLUKN_17395 [Bacilli bacterium]